MRITNKDVRGMFTRATTAARNLGIDVSGWSMQEGSGSVHYTLTMRPYGSLGIGFGGNMLGKTARDAYTALQYMAVAWEQAAYIRGRVAGNEPSPLTEPQRAYVARAIDVARSDREAAALLSPTERDELLARFGGRRA